MPPNAPIRLQMPLCPPKCPALAGGGTQMPLYTRENAPTCPAGKHYKSLIFLNQYQYILPPIIPQNAPIRRGKCPAMCAGKIKCPALARAYLE